MTKQAACIYKLGAPYLACVPASCLLPYTISLRSLTWRIGASFQKLPLHWNPYPSKILSGSGCVRAVSSIGASFAALNAWCCSPPRAVSSIGASFPALNAWCRSPPRAVSSIGASFAAFNAWCCSPLQVKLYLSYLSRALVQ